MADTVKSKPVPSERRSLLATLAPWLTAGVIDVYPTLGRWPSPRWWQFAIELAFLFGAGFVQWRMARGWWRSYLLAPAVVLFYAAVKFSPLSIGHIIPFLLGLLVALGAIVRTVEVRLWQDLGSPRAWPPSSSSDPVFSTR